MNEKLTAAQRAAYDRIGAGGCTYYFTPMPRRVDVPESTAPGANTASSRAMAYRSRQVPARALSALIEHGVVTESPTSPDGGILVAQPYVQETERGYTGNAPGYVGPERHFYSQAEQDALNHLPSKEATP